MKSAKRRASSPSSTVRLARTTSTSAWAGRPRASDASASQTGEEGVVPRGAGSIQAVAPHRVAARA
eukprot:12900992-Heterocapsa_arctica.AAC.1